MAEDALRAKTLGAWEQAIVAYLDAADAVIRHGALAAPPDPLELDLLEVLDIEQGDALHQFLLGLPRRSGDVLNAIDWASPAPAINV